MSEYYNFGIKNSTKFIVKNIAPGNKTIKIFRYPILNGQTRDLLMIPDVSEADIRHSLLKGELKVKLSDNVKEAVVVYSDIDLLQFNTDQKRFLQNVGIIKGLQVDYTNINVLKMEDIGLIGTVNGINSTFTTPFGYFIYDNNYVITVYLNGVRQVFLDDYIIAENGGPGTGYNTIIFTNPPQSIPPPPDVIKADYYVSNI